MLGGRGYNLAHVVVVVVVVILMAFLVNLYPLRQLLYGYISYFTIRCYA